MATNLLDRLPVDQISADARQVHLGRALLVLLIGVFWLLGWLIGKASLGVGFAWVALRTGFTEARNPAEVARGRAP